MALSKFTSDIFFSYYWYVDDKEKEITSIRAYGLDENNKNICLRIDDFTPYIYLELPVKTTNGSNIDWKTKAQSLGDRLDDILKEQKPIKKKLQYKNKLYGAEIDKDNNKKVFPYLLCSFSNKTDYKNLFYILKKPIYVLGLGQIKLKMHEQDASEILQLVSCRDIPTAGWIKFVGKEVIGEEKLTICDKEYLVGYQHLNKFDKNILACPKIMGFDIEVNSTNPSAMPQASKPGDKIVGYNILKFDIQYMIDRAKSSATHFCFNDFAKLGFHKDNISNQEKIKWSSSAFKNQEFDYLDAEGRVFVDLLPLIQRDYKFNNYQLKTVSQELLKDTKDDLSPKGIFKCYRIGIQKEKDGSYSKKAIKAMSVCAKYCLKDSILVVKLMEKLQAWVGLAEMAKTTNISIFDVFTQGQQKKVYSQIYKYCMYQNIVVEKDAYITKENERYVGAHVFPPVPGNYERVLPFDFASLYPTTIIAYNIDYSSWVTDPTIPDEKCNVFKWRDCISCIHDPKVIKYNELSKYIDGEKEIIKKLREERDNKANKYIKQTFIDQLNNKVEELKPYISERSDIKKTISKTPMCEERYYRFLKEPKGVVPTILQNLLDARKNTRKQIKENQKLIEGIDDNKKIRDIDDLNKVLDKRQLAYKISANSMYGILGVKKGLLPFMPGAMVCTYMGRTNIEIVADTITKKYGGKLVYGDTDCVLATEPVLIKTKILDKNIIEYKTVEELSDGKWQRINPNKEISKAKDGYQIWSDTGFTNIVNVVRCSIIKPLTRILTHVGVVNCSNEHSLLTEDLKSITPLEVKIGDKLCISELPLPNDTPKKPIYNNKLTKELIEEYIIPSFEYEGLTAELAFAWGLFYADGSCGEYMSNTGYTKSTWAINNQDNKLLERTCDILNRNETSLSFKILDTMKSSSVNKLVAKQFSKKIEHKNTIVTFVSKYRNLFYNNRRYKKVPSIIFNSPFEIRQSFFMGYYAGDGSRKDPAISLCNKGAIGSAGLFYLMKSVGYQVSINTREDKVDIFKLTGSTPEIKMRYISNAIKKIIPLESKDNEYIYDIQTENHHFAAGVGQLVVHNSNYITFPHLKNADESWDYALKVSKEVSALFPPPIYLEFEQAIYAQFFILTKKRYMYRACGRDGIVDKKIGKKGVLLARRDNALIIRLIYEKLISMIFDKIPRDDVLYYILEELNRICSNSVPHKEYVITKSVGDLNNMNISEPYKDEKGKMKVKIGNYTAPMLPKNAKEKEKEILKKEAIDETDYYKKCLPAVVQLAEKMRNRGQRVDVGTRLEYVIVDVGKNKKQYEKIENIDYFLQHNDIIRIDFLDYIRLMINPVDDLLNVGFKKNIQDGYKFKKDFIFDQYKFRSINRKKMLDEIKSLFVPKLVFKN